MVMFPGSARWSDPSSLAATAPMCGYSIPASGLRPVSMIVAPMPWSGDVLLSPRTSAIRFICLAVCGSSSQMRVPGTAVGIEANGPPVSVPGLGSQVSSWLTPPARKMTSTRFWALASWPVAAALANPAGPRAAAAPAAPRNARRETVCSADRQA
jgi:hypothetical protein